MTSEQHFRALEAMYRAAPFNAFFRPTIEVSRGQAEIDIEIQESHFHAAGAVHGAVYFKMLDDAAFFAANSLETEYFVLTSTFTTYLLRPISAGRMRSIGKVLHQTRSQIIAESVVYDQAGKALGRGSGIFVKGKLTLRDAMGYCAS